MPLPRSAGGCQPPRGAWRFAIPGCNAPLAPCRCQRRRELHAGTRSLRRRRPRRCRPPCSMLPPRWSPAALAAGQTPAPERGKKLDNSRRGDPAGLAGAACARGQTMTLGCSACPKVRTTHRCPRRGGTVRAWWEPPQCNLQSISTAFSSCQGKPLPSSSGRTPLSSVLS